MAGGRVSLSGGVRMQTSSGWDITSPRIEAATDRSRIEAAGGIEATAPFGALRAGQMQLQADDPGGPAVLNFGGGVRLIYQP